MPLLLKLRFACLTFGFFAACASAQVTVKDAWVRATVPQQKGTGAYMQITAVRESRVVEVQSPAAATAEVHEMAMVDNVMRMRPVKALELPAGKTVELKPNGYHVMLTGLKGQIKDGDTITIALTVEDKDKKRETIEVKAPARPLNYVPDASSSKHKHH